MLPDAAFRGLNRFHRLVMRVTRGRLGWRARGMQVLELTTTGARSGLPRTVILTSPRQEDGTFVVVASRYGDDVNPAWLHNLRKDPAVLVATDRHGPVPMHAREATPDEHARLWPSVVADQPHYAAYQAKTDRRIPLVLLEPAPR